MAITVKHTKVSLIPDSGDDSLIEPSDWNDDHVLTGTVPVANGGTGASTLTGYVKGSGTANMTASATIPNTDITGLGTASTKDAGSANGVATLDAGGKVPVSELPAAVLGALSYQGTWNASTNTPTLTSSTGTKGYYYVVAVAGSTNLDGITDWLVGDWAVYNGTVWQKVDNTETVTSVNGQTGAVVLTTTNIAEGTNEYFTTARARTSISAGTGISYDNSTGVVTNSAPDQTVSIAAGTGISTSGTYPSFTVTNTAPDQVVALTGAGTTSITGTYPNFTITSNDQFDGDVVGPASATDNAIARYDSTTGKLIQNSVVTVSDAGAIAGATTITNLDYLDFDTTYNTTLGAGQLGWNGNDTLGLGMIGGNVVQHIGEDTFFYVKASATITKGQLCMFTGAVGSSGVLTAAPATAIPFAEAIIGVAAEDIANNGFGLIQNTGTLKGVDTSAFLDGDVLYYNSAVTGGFTKTFPASGPIVIAAAVAKSGSGGSGILTVRISFQTRVTAGTAMSVTQGNDVVTVTNTAPDQTVVLTAGTGISTSGTYPSFTVTNTAPDQTVAIASGTGISVSGTYPNFTVTNTAPSSGGTVTSVTATSPVTSTGGTTPVIAMPAATGSVNGYLTSTDWTTFNGKAPAVTYTTNYVPFGQGTTTPNLSASFTYVTGTGTLTAPAVSASNGLVINSNTVSASYTIPSGSSAMSAGPMTVASGQTVTVSSGSRWVIL
jgi:hypothetical protein